MDPLHETRTASMWSTAQRPSRMITPKSSMTLPAQLLDGGSSTFQRRVKVKVMISLIKSPNKSEKAQMSQSCNGSHNTAQKFKKLNYSPVQKEQWQCKFVEARTWQENGTKESMATNGGFQWQSWYKQRLPRQPIKLTNGNQLEQTNP